MASFEGLVHYSDNFQKINQEGDGSPNREVMRHFEKDRESNLRVTDSFKTPTKHHERKREDSLSYIDR